MKWNLAELTEDALVAYLRTKCPGTIRVSAAWERDEMEFPAAVVNATGTGPISEPAAWHDPRELEVEVAVMTEGAAELDASGAVMHTARERNMLARSAVMDALFVSDLNAQLVAQGVDGIAFSGAQFATTTRASDGHNLVTIIGGTVYAEPVTGS